MRHDKDRTKTGEVRLVELCPRALEVLKRQLALQAKLKLAGKVSKQHGHSVSTMLTTYATWTEGATDADVEGIKRVRDQRPRAAQIVLNATPANPPQPPEFGTGFG
jgi:hypothetical protein